MTDTGIVERGDGTAAAVVGVEMRQTHPQEGGLQFVEATVDALPFVVVAPRGAIVGQGADLRRQGGIVRHHGPAIAQCSEVFPGIETESGGHRGALGGEGHRAVGLGSIFDEEEMVVLRHRRQSGHIGLAPVEVDGEESPCPRCHQRFHPFGVEQKSGAVDIAEDGAQGSAAHRLGGGHKGHGGDDDFVAVGPSLALLQCQQDERQGIEAVADPYAAGGTGIRAKAVSKAATSSPQR